MNDIDAVDAAIEFIERLDFLDVPYLIGGSVVSSIYGKARSTYDADIVADIPLDYAEPLAAILPMFYVDVEMLKGAIVRKSSCNILHKNSFAKVDIFIPKPRLFDRKQLERRVQRSIRDDFVAWVASPEDMILAKLEWYQMGGGVSERQWRDILEMMLSQRKNLDFAYLGDMASAMKTAHLLRRANEDAYGNTQ